MAIFTSKKVITLVILIVIAGGAAFWIKNSNKSDETDKPTAANNTGTAASTDAQAVVPSAVLKDPAKYKDQEVSVRGSLTQLESDYYLVGLASGDAKSTPSALKIDFNNSGIDPNQYANKGSRSKEAPTKDPDAIEVKPPVTITGKLIQKDPKSEPYIQVSSVKN